MLNLCILDKVAHVHSGLQGSQSFVFEVKPLKYEWGCAQEGPDLAILIRDLESTALDKMMRNASDISPTRKTQLTLTRMPWILE